MGFELTPQSLKKLCRELKLYSSCPELNDVLYLHQKGIVKLKHLDAYTGLKSLHLECNAISTIEGLDALIQLRCLFLNQNLVEYVQGLESLGQLETIDLADNQIKEIKGLACCTKLRQLNLSGNRIRSEEDVSHLLECKSLVSLDIGKNRIDSEDALKVVRRLPLNLLRLSGNPIVSTTKHYRKATLTSMSKLQYLDESPVFEKERRLAQAWLEGGPQAEQDMREKIKQEEAAEREAHRRALDEPDPDQHSKLIEKFHSSDMDNGEKDGRNTDSVSIEDVLYYSTQYDQNSELDTMSNLDRLNMNQEDSFHYTEVDGMTHDASHANIFTPEPDAVDLEGLS